MVQGQVAGRRGQAVGRPERILAAARRPWAREVAVLAGYLTAGVAATWPLASYLTGRLPASRDVAVYVWDMWWVAHQIIGLHNPWSTTYLAAPAGLQLGYHTLVPLLAAVMAPVTLAFGPSAAYNLLVIAVPGLACYAMYRVARLWLPSQTGAIAAGGFFGLSSIMAWHAWYQLNLAAGVLFLPLALEAAVRLRRDPSRKRAIILGVVAGASLLTDQESAVLVAIVVLLTLLPWLASPLLRLTRLVPWLARRPEPAGPGWPRRLAVTGTALAVALVVASPQIAAMVAQGHKRIAEFLVVGGLGEPVTPCGACRQRLREFADPSVLVHCAACLSLRHPGRLAAMNCSAADLNVMALAL